MTLSEDNANKTVAITGASGFVGSHIVKVLLERGYNVRATVRDPNNSSKTQHLKALPGAETRLNLFAADLQQEGAFDEVFQGCDAVFHCASPFFFSNDESLLVAPAVEGALNVLRSAAKTKGLKRVIMTSSCAAVFGTGAKFPVDHVCTEDDWSDAALLREHKAWYPLGKTEAEMKAWEFVNSLQGDEAFQLITMLPPWIFGPMLQPEINESSSIVYNYLVGNTAEIPNTARCLVDVRDVAEAHVLAYEDPNASGRYLLIADSPLEEEFCAILRSVCPTSKVPTKVSSFIPPPLFVPLAPHKLVWNDKKAETLGINFRSTTQMLKDTVSSLYRYNHITQ